MRSVTGTAHFLIHFGVRERACPWRGATSGVFPHPTIYLNSQGKLLHHSFFLCKLNSTTEPTLWDNCENGIREYMESAWPNIYYVTAFG